MRDYLYVYDFCQKYLFKAKSLNNETEFVERYSEKDLRTLGWTISMDGEFKEQAFGILRPIRNP